MKIVSAKPLGVMPVYDLGLTHPDHSFLLESGVVSSNCALVISDTPVEDFIPLQTVGGVRVTAFSHAQVEAAGGLKMDFLRVNSLRDISSALKLIRSRQNVTFEHTDSDGIRYAIVDGQKVYEVQILPFEGRLYDIWNLPEREEVFRDICMGDVATLFQLDAGAARQGLRAFGLVDGKPPLDSIAKLAAFTALDRPGPLDAYVEDPETGTAHNMLVEYANRAKGLKLVGEIEILSKLLPETFGTIVYQEQLQFVFQTLGGTSAIEANNFRNRISKKKMVDVDKIDKPIFMKGAVEKLGQETAEKVWGQLYTFGQYGFNASHAVSYMHISYATAFLKHFYPLEWWTATLSNAERNEIDEKFWKYCADLIKLPDIQYSGHQFEIEGDGIRAPLWLLAGIGEKAHQQLMLFKESIRSLGRPTTIYDLLTWIDKWRVENGTVVLKKNKKGEEQRVLRKATTALNATVIQNLIISGAFDSLFGPEDPTIEDKLKRFAFIYSEVCTHKFKSLAAVYDTSSRAVQFQLRKKVLPAFTDNVADIARADHPDKFKGKAYISRNEWHVLTTLSYEHLSNMKVLPDRDMRIAVIGYVTECRIFSYTNKTDGSKKTAAELTIETEGHRSTFVKWPSKANGLSDSFLQVQKGCVVSCLFSRTKGRDFFFTDVEILTGPLSEPEPNEETPS